MKSRYALAIVFATAITLVSCDRSRSDSEEPRPAPPIVQPGPTPPPTTESESPPAAPQEPKKETRTSQDEERQTVPPIAVPAPAPGPVAPPDQRRETLTDSLKKKMEDARKYVDQKRSEWSDDIAGLGTGMSTLKDSARTAIAPSPEEELRHESIDEIHDRAARLRDQGTVETREGLKATKGSPAEVVDSVIRPNDEVTALLSALITESDAARADAYSNLLVDEIFNEPEMARAKVIKLQLGLRRLAENDLYTNDVSSRVAYVQAHLDDRVQRDGNAELLKDGLLVAGTSLALGAVAGFNGFDGARRMVHDFSPGQTLKATASRVGRAYGATKTKVAGLFRRTADAEGAALKSGQTILAKLTLPTHEIVRRDIRSLGISEDLAKSLALSKVSRRTVGFQEFQDTNMPGLKYAVLDSWDHLPLDAERRVVFSISRWKGMRPQMVVSRRLTVEEADDLVRQLKFTSPDQGGKDFMMVVDAQTGQVTPSRVTAEEMKEAGADLTPAPKAKRSRKSITEAKVDGNIEMKPTTAAASAEGAATSEEPIEAAAEAAEKTSWPKAAIQKVGAATSEAASAIKSKTRSAVIGATEAIKPRLRRFDVPWATAVTVGSAVPMYAFFMEGYGEGNRYGEGHETLYLESLIPEEQIRRLTMELVTETR